MLKRYALNCPSCNEENSVYWFASEPEKPFCNNCEEEINLQDVREKHLFSTEDIQRMIRKALDDFIAEIESNRNRMMLRLSGELRAIGRNHIPPTWESIASTLQKSLEKWGEIAGQQALGSELIGLVAGEILGNAAMNFAQSHLTGAWKALGIQGCASAISVGIGIVVAIIIDYIIQYVSIQKMCGISAAN